MKSDILLFPSCFGVSCIKHDCLVEDSEFIYLIPPLVAILIIESWLEPFKIQFGFLCPPSSVGFIKLHSS